MRQKLIYTILSVGLAYALAAGFQSRLNVHWYVTWISALTVVTWAFYAFDKRVAEVAEYGALKGWRVPEFTLNLLTLLGGFIGAWAGRSMFHHKTNTRKHPLMFMILLLATVLHIVLAIRIISGPPLAWWPPSNWIQFTKL